MPSLSKYFVDAPTFSLHLRISRTSVIAGFIFITGPCVLGTGCGSAKGWIDNFYRFSAAIGNLWFSTYNFHCFSTFHALICLFFTHMSPFLFYVISDVLGAGQLRPFCFTPYFPNLPCIDTSQKLMASDLFNMVDKGPASSYS